MNFKDLAINLEMGEEEYLEMIGLFLETSAHDLADLHSALERGEGPRAAAAVHSIKGAAAHLGLTGIYELTQRIEMEARGRNPLDRNSEWILRVREELDHLAEEFRQVLTGVERSRKGINIKG